MAAPAHESWPGNEPGRPESGGREQGQPYLDVPRRERWPRVLALLIALVVLIMGGVAAWAYTRPHRHLHLDVIPAGLSLADAEATTEASDLLARLDDGVGSDEQSTAYLETITTTSGTATEPIEVVAGKQDEDDLNDSIGDLSSLVATSSFRTGSGPLHLDDRQPGGRGGRLRCAPVTVGTTKSAVCVWADADTVGLTLAPMTEAQLADVTGRIRVDVER